ncbi:MULTISPECIES: NAD(P)H-dependent glycerol-3-phosphate dehydrogenase [Micromonospora]|uniref:Glycerol-3-phosphate dehydrogenase [NAD(P)+] n=1 Tax=Micromonospora chalcea TaxID=1874 RepID=A0ABX9YAW1_MICCH|nr:MULTISPECIES: NAD(P)H-dependent glycerol-3-phosphate dehydrogenase [Micromonospora]EWM65498.1 glycerol-3-phosphate dehydrogenase [Micromonospora sp. M42]MBC8994512.1 NAD(P)-dependent glycerol-3-phosphate dehydrogenase [Micromonospora chalcea]MBQ1060138.1 NAD(P)-dependent glycerol-3-phosphate dehydrogenase [Micromonospora sp. C41]MCK1806666.1 NAD(P)-dependent glycerol-3-phosphate dehydrogenase [Micromonospora sp. R42106]MCK1835729.1 NAD(P)-dependent glycerol-3-phosphate dehydrogenase [Microm
MSGHVAVLGAGSWGTAFAKILADAGRDVTVLARRAAVAEAIRTGRENPEYLPGVRLPERVTATGDAAEAIEGAEVVVLSVPSQTLRGNLADWTPYVAPDATLVSLMKGIELGTTKRMSQVIMETAGVPADRVVVVSGPNLAPEIAAEQPAATVVAGTDSRRTALVQASIRTPYFRPYTNDDVIGCELGGAVKNVIALAYGIATAMGFGDNTRAMLMTRGLAETARLGVALGADPITFAGLAGMGDLVASCSSPMARNRTFGEHLGRGESLEQAQAATRQTAEGVKSCLAIRDLARAHGVEMPITEQIERICHEGMDPRLAVDALMSRTAKPESYE